MWVNALFQERIEILGLPTATCLPCWNPRIQIEPVGLGNDEWSITEDAGQWAMKSELGIARSAVFGLAFGQSFEGLRGGDWGATFGFESEPALVPPAC
jgi:hypothetical protein